jgi:hypothetical protein
MKFRPDSDEHACGERVPGELSDKYADLGGIACMRIEGHEGEHIGMVRDAAIADGVEFCCRIPLGATVHRDDCWRNKPET